MAEAETLFAIPHAGRKPGEPKNALFLTFVQGKTDAPASSGPSSPSGDPSDAPGTFGTPGSPAGCACSTRRAPGQPGFMELALLAAAVAAGARRREGR
jgi:MYXO-CTERM domain-containing protein